MTAKKGAPLSADEHHAAQARFLLQLAKNANVAASCRAAGISRKTAYEWKATEPEFAGKWADALEDATERLEEAAFRRATRPVEPSDTLLIFLLKAHRPDKYRERTDLSHSGNVTVRTELAYVNDWRTPQVVAEGEAS